MKTRDIIMAIIITLLSFNGLFANDLTQTVKGRVLDKDAQISLPGATVVVLGTDPILGTITDLNGYFKIENVPVGRYSIKVSYVGYNSLIAPEVLVSSGKEVYLNIELTESVTKMDEVVVKAHSKKDQPLNTMATLSARTFSVEETRRYAGGMDDPARLASSFAGVSTGSLQHNSIIVRGNSPKGILWRLEGVEIPNPSHFSGANVEGGGFFTIFSSQMLTNSDFYTGAFPAEYGNALAGVFDMKLRNGNSEKREHTFQIGTIGIDISSEGPLKKGKRASYLFNYRYATYALLDPIIPGEGVPKYQDLSFKLNIPTKKFGYFSLWGVGGYDNIHKPENDDINKWEFEEYRLNETVKMIPAAAGFSHKFILNNKTYINTTLAATLYTGGYEADRLDDSLILRDYQFIDVTEGRYIFKSFINHKFGARHTNRLGFTYNYMYYNIDLQASPNYNEPMIQYVKDDGTSGLLQMYTQSKINVTENLVFNIGVHSQYFQMNNNYTIEPRVGMKWNINPKHSVSFGYGMHSQLEGLKVYLARKESANGVTYPNNNLDFSTASHFILGYDYKINENMRLKVEPYFQQLNNVPVIPDSSYSMINFTQEWFFSDSLANDGKGANIGIDITIERFLDNNYFWLLTGSLYESKYTGGDGIERNSKYDRTYMVNGLFGKEFFVGKNDKKNILGISVKATLQGGDRKSPLRYNESIASQEVVYDESKAYSVKNPASFYIDLTITYKRNKPKYTGTWALQIKNLLQSPTTFDDVYNYKTNDIEEFNLGAVIPSLSYKIEF